MRVGSKFLAALLGGVVSLPVMAGSLGISAAILDETGQTHVTTCKNTSGFYVEVGKPGPAEGFKSEGFARGAPIALAMLRVVPEGWSIDYRVRKDTKVSWAAQPMVWTRRLAMMAKDHNLAVIVDWHRQSVLVDRL